MGETKQTLPFGDVSMLEKVLDIYRRSNVDRVIVILGASYEEIVRATRFEKETIVVNHEHAQGMSGSIRIGVEAVEEAAEAVIIALGDQPLVSPRTVDQLVESYKNTKAPVVVPTFKGKRGNPVLFDRSLFQEIKEVKGDMGARSVVLRNSDRVLEVGVDDEGILLDFDTKEDYERARPR